MMQAVLSVLLITMGLGQLISTANGLRTASLVGPSRLGGYGLGMLLVVIGALMLPEAWSVLWWTLPAGPVVLGLLLLAGSFIAPPPHPNRLFSPGHPAHASCSRIHIPDGEHLMPGYLLTPPPGAASKPGIAVCIVPGAGDSKTSFKWRIVKAMLAEGLTVLTIDPPGHGDYRHRPLTYPDCLSAIPAAISFLRAQPGITRVGLAGISLGGALAIRSLGDNAACQVEALVVLETSVKLNLTRALMYREMWHTHFRAPSLSLLKEMSARQIYLAWRRSGYTSPHTTSELIDLLNPLENLGRIKQDLPLLLVYARRDSIAPPSAARAMQRAAPQAGLLMAQKASHVTLTLAPEINQRVARWLRAALYHHF